MRLWRQLALVMAVLAVLPAGVLGALAISTVDDEWRHTSEQRVRRNARRQADELGAWLETRRALVREIVAAFGTDAPTFSAAEQAGLLSLVYRLVPESQLVVLVDGQGELVTSAVPGLSDSRVAELLGRLPLTAARHDPDVAHVGVAWVPTRNPAPSVPIAVRMGDLTLAVELRLPITEGTEDQGIGLLRDDGEALVAAHPLVQPKQLAPLLGVFHEFEMDVPEPAHGALAEVPGSPAWTVVVVEPERALLRLGERITNQILVGAALASLIGVLAALGTALTVSGPVGQLRRKALQLADGHLGVQMGIDRNDEIGDLATAFDHLSLRLRDDQTRIAAQQDEIAAFNEELQSRVEERTRQLQETQDQLVRTSQLAAVAELGAGLAHDLNNPLTGVLGLAQVLKSRHPDDALIASLESEAQRCRDVVSAMQRATTLEIDPSRTVVADMADVVARAAAWVAPSYAQRHIELRTVPPDAPIEAQLDPEQGARILSQILQSVRSGLPENSVVTVREITLPQGDPATHRPAIRIEADRKVAEQPERHDDWLTASRVMWVTHQSIARLGGELHRPEEGRVWQWVL